MNSEMRDEYMDIYSDDDSDTDIDEDGNSDDEMSATDFSNLLKQRKKEIYNNSAEGSDDENELIFNEIDEDKWWNECNEGIPTSNLPQFMGVPGTTIKFENLPNIKESLELFVGEDLLSLFTIETNRYYNQCKTNFEATRNKYWTEITIDEMKKFLALIILMGFIRKIEKNDYWSTDPLISTPIFNKTMSRDRFRSIWRYWHFSNNENCQSRLDKVKQVSNYFTAKFQTIYRPEKELILDKSIIPWRGELTLDLMNPSKAKNGIIVRMVCESTSGYICNFEISSLSEQSKNETIISLLSPFLYLWHTVYMDTTFSSTNLAETLLKYETNTCGPINRNKGVPNSLKNIELKENETRYRRKNDVLLQAWKGTSDQAQFMISTVHSATMDTSVNVTKELQTVKPVCFIDFEKQSKEIDRADQYLNYYSTLRRTKKWTKKTVLFLLNCAIFNAYQIFRKNSESNIKYKKFLLSVARIWLTSSIEELGETQEMSFNETTMRSAKFDPADRLCSQMQKHRIEKIVGQGKLKNPRRACKVCTAQKKRSSTSVICSSCNVPLHPGKCFEIYHTQSAYN